MEAVLVGKVPPPLAETLHPPRVLVHFIEHLL
jgi:hypothetical protein